MMVIKGTGIVYIPAGRYKVSGTISVPACVNVSGNVPWAHSYAHYNNNTMEYQTTIYTDSKFSDKIPLFVLNHDTTLDGITIVYDGQMDEYDTIKKYAPTIRTNGDNIHILNVLIEDAWDGIDLATNKSSNHYVRNITGVALNKMIYVGGGSENGIIANCHITSNTIPWSSFDTNKNAEKYLGYLKIYKYYVENAIAYEIGNSSNERLLNNFVWGAAVGYNITDNAKDFTVLAGGSDKANKSVLISGNVKGKLSNMLLVAKNENGKIDKELNTEITKAINSNSSSEIVDVGYNMKASNNHYIETTPTFSGEVNIVNPLCWGNSDTISFVFRGQGKVIINGGIIADKSDKERQIRYGTDVTVDTKKAIKCYPGGDDCIKTKRDSNVPESEATLNTPEWNEISIKNVKINSNYATATLCNLMSKYEKIKGNAGVEKSLYYYNENKLQEAKIDANGCANISLSAKYIKDNNRNWYYYIDAKGKRETSVSGKRLVYQNTASREEVYVKDIGKYLLLAQVYQYLLMQDPTNGVRDMGYWVSWSDNFSSTIKELCKEVVRITIDVDDETFITNLYRSILGRESGEIDDGGKKYWLDELAKYKSSDDQKKQKRVDTLFYFIDSEEIQNIYKAWGYK